MHDRVLPSCNSQPLVQRIRQRVDILSLLEKTMHRRRSDGWRLGHLRGVHHRYIHWIDRVRRMSWLSSQRGLAREQRQYRNVTRSHRAWHCGVHRLLKRAWEARDGDHSDVFLCKKEAVVVRLTHWCHQPRTPVGSMMKGHRQCASQAIAL